MPDFTLKTYQSLMKSLLAKGFSFQTFAGFLEGPANKVVILRHDVDLNAPNSLITAQIEHALGICGSYYFRTVPQSNIPYVIREIASLGHEIGYHYEDMAICNGMIDDAIKSFEKNLQHFRQFGPVKTICMHGSPMSKYDNRKIWEKHNYRDFGIIGEPYFDVDFTKVLYLTDTGRCWDGDKYNVRDNVETHGRASHGHASVPKSNFHSTFDIIRAANEDRLPDKIMITVHPQRWTDNPVLWAKELVWQNVKNQVKRIVVRVMK